jgi:adenosylcobinamide-GDP ribazoletransferase
MIKVLNNFLLMLQFLTRIPVNISLECDRDNFKKGAFYIPIVGLIVGGIQWGVYLIFNRFLPPYITAAFIIAVSTMVTGALHVDGLGDTCDGFYAFKGKDRIIEIMKDSRIGTFACIAIVLDILLKVMCISFVVEKDMSLIIIAYPVLARTTIVLLSYIGKSAKSSGSGNLFIGNMSTIRVTLASITALILCTLLIGARDAAILSLVSVVLTVLVNKYSNSKIDGITGDILGANNELAEIFILVAYIAINNI